MRFNGISNGGGKYFAGKWPKDKTLVIVPNHSATLFEPSTYFYLEHGKILYERELLLFCYYRTHAVKKWRGKYMKIFLHGKSFELLA